MDFDFSETKTKSNTYIGRGSPVGLNLPDQFFRIDEESMEHGETFSDDSISVNKPMGKVEKLETRAKRGTMTGYFLKIGNGRIGRSGKIVTRKKKPFSISRWFMSNLSMCQAQDY